MSDLADPGRSEGWIDPVVAREFPALRLVWTEVHARATRSPAGVKQRLRELSDGFRGPRR